MKKLIITTLLFAVCTQASNNHSKSFTGPEILFFGEMPDSLRNAVSCSVENYFVHYKKPTYIGIFFRDDGNLCKMRETDKGPYGLLAYTLPIRIYLCPQMTQKLSSEDMYNLISHEVFHSFANDTLFNEPMQIWGNTIQITGYHGLSVLIEIQGKPILFKGVEEWSAEICAKSASETYKIQYTNLYRKIDSLSKVDKRFVFTFTPEELINLEKTHDFKGFVARCVNKSKEKVDSIDFQKVMEIFSLD